MRIIIAGSRDITSEKIVWEAIYQSGFFFSEIVSGMARGVDTLALEVAKKLEKPVKKFPANWNKYKKRAGYLRNVEMAKYADGLIAIWDGKSKGTKMMIDIAKKEGLEVFVYEINKHI